MHLQCVFTNLLLKLWESEDQCFHIFRDRSNFENTNNLSLQDFSDFYASLIFLTFYSWYISQTHQWNKYDQIYESEKKLLVNWIAFSVTCYITYTRAFIGLNWFNWGVFMLKISHDLKTTISPMFNQVKSLLSKIKVSK